MRAHRQAFPTPRGATGGCPPPGNGMRGTPPRPPRERETRPEGRPSEPPRGTRGVSPRLRYAGDAPAAPGGVARRLRWTAHLGKHLGMFIDVNVNHGVQDSLADLMREIDGRTRGFPNAD